MSLPEKELYWLAGLLEGEGYFGSNSGSYPVIYLGMTDYDVVEKVATIFEATIHTRPREAPRKICYVTQISGLRAAEFMKELLPLMGSRRKYRIEEVLKVYEARTFKGRGGHKAWNNGRSHRDFKLTKKMLEEIKTFWDEAPVYGKQSELARKFNVTPARIRQIVRSYGATV
jgi:hypothetical protein